MERYIELLHPIGTLALLIIYLVLAISLYRRKKQGIGGINRALAQLGRFGLVVVYFSGLFLSITLGRIVHTAHHILSALPILALYLIRFLPERFTTEKANKTYAWFFAILCLLLLLVGITAHLSILPKL